MAVEQVTMYRDSFGEVHATKTMAEQADAWRKLLKAFDAEHVPGVEKAEVMAVLQSLYAHREVVREYFRACEAMFKEPLT